MHINMKYYIVTIGAIFIALGIGILVGFNLNYDQELSKQQTQVIKDLDIKFDELKATNDNLDAELTDINNEYDKVIGIVNNNIDKLISNELLDNHVGIISTSDIETYSNELVDLLNKSNSKISYNISLKSDFYSSEKLKEASNVLNENIKDIESLISHITKILKSDKGSTNLYKLEELGIIKINSLDSDFTKCNSVILDNSNANKDNKENLEKVDKFFISNLKSENKYIVAVQKTEGKQSLLDLYTKEKISSIDNIDEGIGKLSLVILLKEKNIVGNFGRLDEAQSKIPYKK